MRTVRPVFLFTDFGWSGPYVGQLHAAVVNVDADIPVVDLMHDAPAMRPEFAAYLLPACCQTLPSGAVVVAVVDPGVGGARDALIVETTRLTYVGPDNGLLSRVDDVLRVWRIDWRPEALSASFHGRDLFAPVAARLALGQGVERTLLSYGRVHGATWSSDRQTVIYIDAYGNAMTGVRAKKCNKNSSLMISGQRLPFARTFTEAAVGTPFWTANSQGLVEIAANRASAANVLDLALGSEFLID